MSNRNKIKLAALSVLAASAIASAAPSYNITYLGPNAGRVSQGLNISSNGRYVSGQTTPPAPGTAADAFVYDVQTGTATVLPDLTTPARTFSFGQAVNDNGVVAGRGATTAFGSSPIPVIWQNGTPVTPPAAGDGSGRANGINAAGNAVGSVGGGNAEAAAIFTSTTTTVIPQTFANGGVLRTAFGINNAGRIVGTGSDPNNAALTRGFALDPGASSATDIGALTSLGHNSAIPFGVSSDGKITGSSSINSGSGGRAFLYQDGLGMTEVPLAPNTSSGIGRGVNSSGFVVGVGSGQFAVPFLYDGTQTYDLETLLVNGAGWDLNNNTSSIAIGIGDNGSIVGTGVFNGTISAFLLTPVPEPTSLGVIIATLPLALRRRRG